MNKDIIDSETENKTFEDTNLDKSIVTSLKNLQFTRPTPI